MKLLGGSILKDWNEECAVFGVWGDPEAARMCFLGLYAQQHRGQEAAGVALLSEKPDSRSGKLDHKVIKGEGLVADVLGRLRVETEEASAGIGHVRYSTSGKKSSYNIQPIAAKLYNGPVSIAHNGHLTNAHIVKDQLKEKGAIYQGTSDTETILHLIAQSRTDDLVESLKLAMPQVEGAYSLLVLGHNKMAAMRDPWGFRPLSLGVRETQDGKKAWVLASETCAFDLIGAQFVRDIEPGEIWWVDENGTHSAKLDLKRPTKQCVFEHVYFSRPDSIVFGQSVYLARQAMGIELAKEKPVEADVVIPVPDSGVPAALGYSKESGIPFDFGVIRNHYVGRTFIQPSDQLRQFSVKMKLNPQAAVLKGKRVIIIDDSLVRGTTSRQIIRLVKQAGAKEVHFRVASPPTTGPCYYGVDTPKKEDLIACQMSEDEICKAIEADSLAYLSLESLKTSVLKNQTHSKEYSYCQACFDGKYPTEIFEH